MNARIWSPPLLSLRFIHVWRRNMLVWRKLAMPSVLGNLADPMLYMLGFGYGLGTHAARRVRHLVHRVSRRRHRVLVAP